MSEQATHTQPERSPPQNPQPTPDPEVEQLPSVMRRNYRLGVANGALFTFADSLSSANLVLAQLIRQLGGSLDLVGLLPALQNGGYLLPQMIVGGRVQAQPYKLPLYRNAAIARLSAWSLLTIMIFISMLVPANLSLWLIIVAYMIFNIGGGTSTLAFQDVVAKVIPARRRGSFFGMRQLLGGLLTVVLAGPLVRWLLGEHSPLATPLNFGVLCLASLVSYTVGLYLFAIVREPPQSNLGAQMRMIDGLRRAPSLLRQHRNYRWFIISRMLTRAGQIAEPFYQIYALEMLHLPTSVTGIYVALRAIAGASSNLAWGRISARSGNRQLMVFTGWLVTLTPTLALFSTFAFQKLNISTNGLIVIMGLVFLVSGAANDGNNIANSTYLLEIVPESERATYVGLANTMLGLVTFLPVIGGQLIEYTGYHGTFALGCIFSLLGLTAVIPLTEVDSALERRGARRR